MVTAVVESPLRQRQRLPSPLSGSVGSTTGVGGVEDDDDDLEARHVRPAKRASGSGSGGGMRGRWAPPQIEIPGANGLDGGGGGGGGGVGRGYTSLRDLMPSPTAKAATAIVSSPDEQPPGGGVHMIRHPLVKHAAYTYLQLTPTADEARRRMLQQRRRRGGPLCRLFLGCLGFLGALFGR